MCQVWRFRLSIPAIFIYIVFFIDISISSECAKPKRKAAWCYVAFKLLLLRPANDEKIGVYLNGSLWDACKRCQPMDAVIKNASVVAAAQPL